MITNNWDYHLTVSIYADDPDGIASMLRDIARRIKNGGKVGDENFCDGTYEFTLEETPVTVEDEE